MYIEFMDILRDIKHGIYPQVSQWRDEVGQLKADTEGLKHDVEVLKAETIAEKDLSIAAKNKSEEYSETAKDWSKYAENAGKEDRWNAEAARLTAASFATEPYGQPVKVYTSNNDGTFTSRELKFVFSALHHREDTEQITGHKRWIETQTATSENNAVFGFTKTISNADVYVNGERKVDGIHYTKILNDITFDPALNDGDLVTVSGMEALTGSEFATLLEETKIVEKNAKLDEWRAQAAEMTAKSYATEPLDVFTKIYTSNDDGTFSVEETLYYSVYHWSIKFNIANSSVVIVDKYEDLDLLNVNYAKVAYVRGGYELDDGKQGLFDFYEDDSDVNNHGTNINGWRRRYDGYALVSWFDVKGDGYTDDTEALRVAIDACQLLDLESGKYVITEPVEITGTLIKSDNAVILPDIDEGTAITFKGYRDQNALDGNLYVDWGNSGYDKERVSFDIDDSVGSSFNMSTINGTCGVRLKPTDGNVTSNTINIGIISDPIVGAKLENITDANGLTGNVINGGKISNTHDVSDSDFDGDKSFLLSAIGDYVVGNTFNMQELYVDNNSDGKCKLFNIEGTGNTIKPLSATINNDDSNYGVITGSYNVLNIMAATSLTAYVRNEDGVTSNIDISGSDKVTVVGKRSVEKYSDASAELSSGSDKPTQTIENTVGIATSYPVVSENKVAVRIYNEGGDTESTHSDNTSTYRNTSTSNESLVDTDHFHINDGTYSIDITKETVDITDGVNHSKLNKDSSKIYDETTSYSEITRDSLVIIDDVDSFESTKEYVKIKDSNDETKVTKTTIYTKDDTDSLTGTKTDITITDGTDEFYASKTESHISDGTDSSAMSKTSVSVSDTTDSAVTTKTSITISDDDYSNTLTKKSIEITDGTDTFASSRTSVKISDDTYSNESTKQSSIITDGTLINKSEPGSAEISNGDVKLTETYESISLVNDTKEYNASVNEVSVTTSGAGSSLKDSGMYIKLDADNQTEISDNHIELWANRSADDTTTRAGHLNMYDNGTALELTIRDKDDNAIESLKIKDDDTITFNGHTVWHSDNDGAGSELDADKLDGLESSQLLRNDQAGSVSGDIEFTDELTGVILNDRNDDKKWRLFVNDGSLSIEEV